VTYSISSRWLAVVRALAEGTGARFILGVNLEANQPLIAAAEARALLSGLGIRSVLALEIGNEPNWYATLPWYRNSAGRQVPGRPTTYDVRAFTAEFSALRKPLPRVALAGPAVGALPWLRNLPGLLVAEPTPRVGDPPPLSAQSLLHDPRVTELPDRREHAEPIRISRARRRNRAVCQDRASAS
jgi:hypothetical protein